MQHSFNHYDEHEIEHLDDAARAHLVLVDQALNLVDTDPATLEAMTDAELVFLIASHRKPEHRAAQTINRHAAAPRALAGPSFPAKVWDSNLRRMVHIGMYRTAADRDAAIADAKARRALGLPIKPNGQPTNGH